MHPVPNAGVALDRGITITIRELGDGTAWWYADLGDGPESLDERAGLGTWSYAAAGELATSRGIKNRGFRYEVS